MGVSHVAQAKSGVFRIPQETERFPQHRHEALKWNGWGYTDSQFYLNDEGARRHEIARCHCVRTCHTTAASSLTPLTRRH